MDHTTTDVNAPAAPPRPPTNPALLGRDLDVLRSRLRDRVRQNLLETTGACVCDEAWTDRGLVDPQCGWHEAAGTVDDDSVGALLDVVVDWLTTQDDAAGQSPVTGGTQRVDLHWYADRITSAQELRQGALSRSHAPRPVGPFEVAAVLHAMADHTMNLRLIGDVIDGKGLCPPGDDRYPRGSRTVSIGRWFHQVADTIELKYGATADGARS